MTTNLTMFWLLSGVILVFSLLTIFSKRILRAAVSLLFVLVATAGFYFMLGYEFMAGVQVTLYAGGIVVLIIFSILLTSHVTHKFDKPLLANLLLGGGIAVLGSATAIYTILNHTFVPSTEPAITPDMHTIGHALLSVDRNGYVLPFEVISVLLLAAMIAGIIIARKETKQ
ncbi:MAG TPA: NADH-quinone oxidoreductase subunit J [Bacteroidales bacterium]|nr:NADH-quinone oxidoreductase subunit J [Bacteroidales bacterium]